MNYKHRVLTLLILLVLPVLSLADGPTNVPPTSTQPFYVQALTKSLQTGRCNLHLDGDGPYVYVGKPELYASPGLTAGEVEIRSMIIHQNICDIAAAAKASRLRVTVTYQGGESPGSGSPTYWQFEMLRLTVEDKADPSEGLIPWTNREPEQCASPTPAPASASQ